MYGKTNDPNFSHIEGSEDHSLDMLFVYEPDGRLCGALLDIPCPAQVDEHLLQVSADYWHEYPGGVKKTLGQGLYILPLCGAGGDQSPHFLIYQQQEAEMRQRRGLTEHQGISGPGGQERSRARPGLHASPGLPDTLCSYLPAPDPYLAALPSDLEERDWAAAKLKQALRRGDKPEEWWPEMLHPCDRAIRTGQGNAARTVGTACAAHRRCRPGY